MSDSNLTSTITSLEDETWKALQKSGKDFLPFLAPDCIMLFPLGLQVSRQSEPTIEDILTSETFIPWESYKMLDVAVTPIGPAGAVITYRAEARRPDAGEFHALISSVWRKEADGRWLLAVHQQTPFSQEIEDVEVPAAE